MAKDMIELLVLAGAALMAYGKSQTFEGKMESLQSDLKAGKISPNQAKDRYAEIINAEIAKIPDSGVKVPPNIKEAFENGFDYRSVSGKVDADTYNALHYYYWNGEWDSTKVKK